MCFPFLKIRHARLLLLEFINQNSIVNYYNVLKVNMYNLTFFFIRFYFLSITCVILLLVVILYSPKSIKKCKPTLNKNQLYELNTLA